MTVDLRVEPGTQLFLLLGEFTPNPNRRDEIIRAVAVYRQPIGGRVWVRGHTCTGVCPYANAGWCWEGRVSVAAIRANLAGQR
ncbi:hypothetical protein ACIA5A_06085 [Micromonospora sp. NPDC051300]|uniref:hypothetical protein n=1 Tax=Micromonospora sp. NPDC051300 TaxID=3364286 RepID=UPI0037904BD5